MCWDFVGLWVPDPKSSSATAPISVVEAYSQAGGSSLYTYVNT